MDDKRSLVVRIMVARRKREKMSQKTFAEILGRSEVWMRKMEAGGCDPNYETLSRFVRRFNVDPRDMFEWPV